MARRADARVERPAARRISGAIKLLHPAGTEPRQLLAGRHATAEKLNVGDYRQHLRRIGRQWMSVHAPRHARIDAILDADLVSGTRTVLRKIAVEAEQGQSKFLSAGLKVAITAGKIIAGKALGLVRHIRTNIGVTGSDQVAAFADLKTMHVARQGTDFGHGPDCAGLRPRLHTRRCDCGEDGEQLHDC